MVETISKKTKTARKEHIDDAGVWVREQLDDIRISVQMSFSEWRAVARLKAERWKIKPGQTYEQITIKQDGKFYTFRCLPEINEICHKYELYSE